MLRVAHRLRRRRAGDPDEPSGDLTPMIDIVFNLLVFFMTATKLRSAEAVIEAYLPKDRGPSSGHVTVPLEEPRIVLRLQPDGQVRVRLGEPLGLVPVEGLIERHEVWSALHARLVLLRDAHKGETPLSVIVDAQPEVPTRMVVLAVNEVLRADLHEVTFAAPAVPF